MWSEFVCKNCVQNRGPGWRVKSEEVHVSRTIPANGVPFGQLVKHNGQPRSAGEERKQKEEIDKLKHVAYRPRNGQSSDTVNHQLA